MLFWFVIIAIGFFAVISAYLYFNQKNMVFYPTRELMVTPDQVRLEFEDVNVSVDGESGVHGWYLPADSGSRVFLFCHGNAGNISHRIETVEFLHHLGAAVMIFDYRGYGKSTGEPTEEGLYADARACYNWLIDRQEYRGDDILIFGRSLGGAVAVNLASEVACRALIIESSFTSAADMARKIFPILPTSLFLRYKFNSLGRIEAVRCPVLVTHSPDDDLIPFEMGQRLFERARPPKQFVKLSGGHNSRDYLASPEYHVAFRVLLDGE